MEQLADDVPMLTLLDSPVPQVVDHVVAVLARYDTPIPEQVIEVPKISCPHASRVQFFERRRWRNSWWKCRRSSVSSNRKWTFPSVLGVILVEVSQVFSQDRVSPRLPSRPLTIQLLVMVLLEVILVLSCARARCSVLRSRSSTFLFLARVMVEGWSRSSCSAEFLPRQGSTAFCGPERRDDGGFHPRQSSASFRGAIMMMSVFKPSTLTLKVRPDDGVAMVEHGRQFFWNRRHDTTPRHSSPRRSRGEGLGIPSPLLVCHFWQSCSVSACCLRRTVLDSSGSGYASVLCVFRQRIQLMCQSSVALVVISHIFVRRWTSDPEVDSRTDTRISCEPLVFGSHWFGLCRVRCTGILDLLGLPSGIFRVTGMLRVPFGCRLAPVAWHGRYGPEGQYYRGYGRACTRLVLLVSLLALFFFCRCQSLMPCIMASMDQIDRCTAW